MKKLTKVLLSTALAIIIIGTGFAWWNLAEKLDPNKPCAFCNPQVLARQTFYEDSLVMGLYDYNPIQPGHCQAVVKRHVATFDETTEEEITAIGRLIKKINMAVQNIYGPSSYVILQKNGREAGQTVPHVHFHYIPKKKTKRQRIAAFGLLWQFIARMFRRPIPREELAKNVALMKQAFK